MENQIGMKWEFRNDTWQNPNFMYDPSSRPFFQLEIGPTFIYQTLPTFITLFELSWTPTIMKEIVRETNRYVNTLDAN